MRQKVVAASEPVLLQALVLLLLLLEVASMRAWGCNHGVHATIPVTGRVLDANERYSGHIEWSIVFVALRCAVLAINDNALLMMLCGFFILL